MFPFSAPKFQARKTCTRCTEFLGLDFSASWLPKSKPGGARRRAFQPSGQELKQVGGISIGQTISAQPRSPALY